MKEYYNNDLKKLCNFISGDDSDYVVLNNLIGDVEDVQAYLEDIRKKCTEKTRVAIIYYNHLWEPVLKLATWFGWRKETGEQNWLNNEDIANLLRLSGFEIISKNKRLLVPVYVPFISSIFNKFIGNLPIINDLCLTTWIVARVIPKSRQEYSVSIIVPARNEAGNIERVCRELPMFGKRQEIIFVEGHSKDNTWSAIEKVMRKKGRSSVKIKAFRQSGIGKADAVRLGFNKASGEMLMILDADLTVPAGELVKFYEAVASRKAEFVNGTRMIYPMESQAMRSLNKIGNRIFSFLFSWILGQRFTDTLCGTKVLLKSDYLKIAEGRKLFGDFDPFGDFDLIFGAVKQNLKVIEVPIRYRDRKYGQTQISRFKHGWLLLKMTLFAFNKFRGW